MEYETPAGDRVQQGIVLRGISLPFVKVVDGQLTFVTVPFAYALVTHQDCDLLNDSLARRRLAAREGSSPVSPDKELIGVLICPGFEADQIKTGAYRSGAPVLGSALFKAVIGNRNERFFFLPKGGRIDDDVVFDFKQVFTVPSAYIETWLAANPDFVTGPIASPYRERMVQRFTNYLARIALPDDE